MATDEPKTCDDYRFPSPENGACGWCLRYRINLDTAGRLCARCAGDGSFRSILARQAAARFGANGCDADTSYCEIFDTATDAELCARCRRDGEFRQFLHGQAAARRARQRTARLAGCRHRGEVLRRERRSCCGGETKKIAIHACAVRGEAHEGVCAECEAWQA